MAKNSVKSPLNEGHYITLKTLRKSVTQTREYLTKCKKCQLDIEDEMKATDDQLAVINALIREFFPDKPLE